MGTLVKVWNQEERVLGKPIALLDPALLPNLKHAYEKYDGFNPSINFDLVYAHVVDFIDYIVEILYGYSYAVHLKWTANKRSWF